MTNTDLQALVGELGPKLAVLIMDNGMHLFINFKNRDFRIEDIEYKTFGTADAFCIPRNEYWDPVGGKRLLDPVVVKEWHLTECIQSFTEVSDAQFALDPLKIK